MTSRTMEHASNPERAVLRQRVLAAREALDDAQYARALSALEVHLWPLLLRLSPACLGFCWPHRAEPDLRPLVSRWLRHNPAHRAALPEVAGRGQALHFREWTPETPMRSGVYGIEVPEGTSAVQPDVLLVPLNAFDARGYRLGYGGGYFDRTLAAHDYVAIGVGFELGRVDSVWPQAHDRPMQWIVTEAGAWPAERP